MKNDGSYFSAIDFFLFVLCKRVYIHKHIHKHKKYTGTIIKQEIQWGKIAWKLTNIYENEEKGGASVS